jgi:hypothetical protein
MEGRAGDGDGGVCAAGEPEQARARFAAAGCASAARCRETAVPARTIHRRCDRGIQEEVTMLELFILAAGIAAGYAASVYSWPWIRARAIGAGAEINQLRARAKALEDSIKGAL